jgi:hypothetical protein
MTFVVFDNNVQFKKNNAVKGQFQQNGYRFHLIPSSSPAERGIGLSNSPLSRRGGGGEVKNQNQ